VERPIFLDQGIQIEAIVFPESPVEPGKNNEAQPGNGNGTGYNMFGIDDSLLQEVVWMQQLEEPKEEEPEEQPTKNAKARTHRKGSKRHHRRNGHSA
jgi:hypothetical protein